MSTKKKVVVTTPLRTNTNAAGSRPRNSTVPVKKRDLVFSKANYQLMLIGIGIIALGLFLMSGGAMPSPDVWDESIIYSTRRTLIAPIVILIGLAVEIYAIFYQPKKSATDTGEPQLPGI